MFHINLTTPHTIYNLTLHDALPIYVIRRGPYAHRVQNILWSSCFKHFTVALRYSILWRVSTSRAAGCRKIEASTCKWRIDRKSTRLNSSHTVNSYAVFCLKKQTKYI